MNSSQLLIEGDWSLFLDRDGVINHRIVGDYVRSINQLELYGDIEKTIANLSGIFAHTFVVTNQQGIGKGLMTSEDVEQIHEFIAKKVKSENGKIDAFYFAPQLKIENHPLRKPGIGMALKAKMQFPLVDFKKSVMVGDSESDIVFGKKAGMKTVFIQTQSKKLETVEADFSFASLQDFANWII